MEGETAVEEAAEEEVTEVVVGQGTKGEDVAKREGRLGDGDRGDVHGDAHVHDDVHAGVNACDTCWSHTSPPSGYLRHHPEGKRGSLESREENPHRKP